MGSQMTALVSVKASDIIASDLNLGTFKLTAAEVDVDSLKEKTSSGGVNLASVLKVDHVAEKTLNAGTTFDTALLPTTFSQAGSSVWSETGHDALLSANGASGWHFKKYGFLKMMPLSLLTSIDLDLYKVGTGGGNITVTVYQYAGAGNTVPTPLLITSTTTLDSSTLTGGYVTHTFAFPATYIFGACVFFVEASGGSSGTNETALSVAANASVGPKGETCCRYQSTTYAINDATSQRPKINLVYSGYLV